MSLSLTPLAQVIDDFLPSLLVSAEWPSSNSAELGNTIKPKKLQDEPTITLTRPKSEEGACSSFADVTYTVTLTDPDAPSRDDPKWSEFCHWIATGLATSVDEDSSCSSPLTLALKDLDDIMSYYPPGPPEKTGKHRYVLFVFAPANGTTDSLDLIKPEDRKHWGYEYEGERVGVRRWSLENGLVPVGMFNSCESLISICVYHLGLYFSSFALLLADGSADSRSRKLCILSEQEAVMALLIARSAEGIVCAHSSSRWRSALLLICSAAYDSPNHSCTLVCRDVSC